MERSPAISVVLPTCRRTHLLREALESVRAQTHQDFEVIVVNDAPDEAQEVEAVVRALSDRRARVIHQATQTGAAGARNAGTRFAQGAVIAFLDDDDLFLPHKLARHLEAHYGPGKPGVVYSGVVRRWLDARRPDVVCRERPVGTDVVGKMQTGRFCPATTSCVTVAADALRRVGGFDGTLGSFDDWDLWFRLGQSARFACLPEPLAVFRSHAGPRLSRVYQDRLSHIARVVAKWPDAINAREFTSVYAFSATYDHFSGKLQADPEHFHLGAALMGVARLVRTWGQAAALVKLLAKYALGNAAVERLRNLRSAGGAKL